MKKMDARYLGSPHKTALVFLHGFMGSGEDWFEIAKDLQQDFYCILPDLPGHGATALDEFPGYNSWSAALSRMLRDQQINQPWLIGYSLGGRLALYYSLSNPQGVGRLILESTNPGLSETKSRHQRATQDAAMSARILQDGLELFINTWYDLPLFESLNRHPGLKEKLRRQRSQQSPHDMAAVLQALSPGYQPDLWSRLPEIQVPTLLITGKLDQKYTNIMSKMEQTIPGSQLILLNGCGHNVHRECPSQYLKILYRWFNQENDDHQVD